MELTIHDDKVPIRIDEGGAVRVGPTRVTLAIVLNDFKEGLSAEEIQRSYSTLRLEDVYAVIAYYLRHRAELDDWLADCERRADELQKEIESSQPDLDEFRARIRARWEAMRAADASVRR
jgi:uncharacterized protein (DUF433 family)